jgi:enoyl-CoA hydratase
MHGQTPRGAMELERRREGAVEILTLNRPAQRNALNPELIERLSTALTDTRSDDSVHAIVLTGAGDRAFCAGMDLKSLAAQGTGAPRRDPAATSDFTGFLRGEYPKPVVGAVNGTAVAGGFELVMACDVAVAADHALFGIPEVKRGLFAAGGGVTLPARIPLAIALELGLTGDFINAQRAWQLGLVNRVLPAAEVLPAALELANRISVNGPLAVAATKAMMRTVAQRGVQAGYAMIDGLREQVFGSEDALEGARAFAEKRPPHWTGR